MKKTGEKTHVTEEFETWHWNNCSLTLCLQDNSCRIYWLWRLQMFSQ